jgi:large subunit ribosomal protein L28
MPLKADILKIRHADIARLRKRSNSRSGAAKNTEETGVRTMAQICDICGKGPRFGNNISHANNITRRRWNVNLQAVKALVNGAPKKLRVCATCIKSGKVAKA